MEGELIFNANLITLQLDAARQYQDPGLRTEHCRSHVGVSETGSKPAQFESLRLKPPTPQE